MKNIPDMVMGFILILFAAIIYGLTLQLPDSLSQAGLTPAAFPRLLAIIIACLSAALIIKACFVKDNRESGPVLGPLFGKMIFFFLVIMGYIWLIPQVGYTVSTFSFLVISVCLMMPQRSAKDFTKVLVFVMLATTCVYVVFGIFLSVPLIEGPVDLFLRYQIFASPGTG